MKGKTTSVTDFLAQEYRSHKEYDNLKNVFVVKPHLFAKGACIYTVNESMDGVEFVMGIGNNKVVTGVARYKDMNKRSTKKHLAELFAEWTGEQEKETQKK